MLSQTQTAGLKRLFFKPGELCDLKKGPSLMVPTIGDMRGHGEAVLEDTRNSFLRTRLCGGAFLQNLFARQQMGLSSRVGWHMDHSRTRPSLLARSAGPRVETRRPGLLYSCTPGSLNCPWGDLRSHFTLKLGLQVGQVEESVENCVSTIWLDSADQQISRKQEHLAGSHRSTESFKINKAQELSY